MRYRAGGREKNQAKVTLFVMSSNMPVGSQESNLVLLMELAFRRYKMTQIYEYMTKIEQRNIKDNKK